MAAGLAMLAALATAPASAQTFPHRPVKLVVPFTPGGSTDISTRLLAAELAPILGQPVLVENKPGNAGGIGIDFVSKAEPDGYTLGISGVGPTILLNLTGQHTGYNTLRDLTFVSHQVSVELVFMARKDFAPNNVRELIAHAKAYPGKVSFGNSGINGPVHLANELFAAMAGIATLAVPYKGDAPTLQDLMAGQLDIGLASVPSSTSAIKAGLVKPIAMAGLKRSANLSAIPTVDESGIPGYDASVFQIVVAPAKTPAAIIERLNAAVNKALATPTIKDKYADLGMIPTGGSVKEATDFVRRETDKWQKVIDMLDARNKK